MFVIQKIIRYTRGYVRIRVQGYSSERFLNLCSRHEIFIWGVEPAGDTYELFMPLSGFWKIRAIARKTHTKVTVIQRFGLPFFVYQNRRRQAFLAGCLLCIGLLFFIPVISGTFISKEMKDGQMRHCLLYTSRCV